MLVRFLPYRLNIGDYNTRLVMDHIPISMHVYKGYILKIALMMENLVLLLYLMIASHEERLL